MATPEQTASDLPEADARRNRCKFWCEIFVTFVLTRLILQGLHSFSSGMASTGKPAKDPIDKMAEEGKLSPALELDWELVSAADAEPTETVTPGAEPVQTNQFKPYEEISSDDWKSKLIAYKTLEAATESFHEENRIGTGPYAEVYKGKRTEGEQVVVRKLHFAQHADPEGFLKGACFLTGVRHPHIINLVDFCENGGDFYMVHEYVEAAGTIGTVLFGIGHWKGRKDLVWEVRSNIALGVARGLACLHEELGTPIIHGGLTTRTVMLENDFSPRLFDFGMSFLFPKHKIPQIKNANEAIGYTAPENREGSTKNEKSDVYSFGVLMLVLASGRDVFSPAKYDMENLYIVDSAWALYNKGKIMEFRDEKLGEDPPGEEFVRLMKVAFLCVQHDPESRPKMSHVVEMLSGNVEISDDTFSEINIVPFQKAVDSDEPVHKKPKTDHPAL